MLHFQIIAVTDKVRFYQKGRMMSLVTKKKAANRVKIKLQVFFQSA